MTTRTKRSPSTDEQIYAIAKALRADGYSFSLIASLLTRAVDESIELLKEQEL
jgi:hypothetical protein